MSGRFREVNFRNLRQKDKRTPARRITVARSSPRAAWCLLAQPTSTKNSAPSINPLASFFGKQLFPSPATPLPPPTKWAAANSSSSPPAAGKIPSLLPAASTLLLLCLRNHRTQLQNRNQNLSPEIWPARARAADFPNFSPLPGNSPRFWDFRL